MRIQLYVALLTFLISVPSTSYAKESDYIELASAFSELRNIEGDLYGDMFTAINSARTLITEKPNVDQFRLIIAELNKDLATYKPAAEKMRMILDKNKDRLKEWPGYTSLRSDMSKTNINDLEAVINALTQLSEGVKQKTFSVYAAESWANSGITVEPGDLIYVEAANSWSVSPNYGQASMFGYADTLNSAYAINNQYALGALLYRVRGSQYRNGYGFNQYSRGEADTAGRLEFTINDSQLRNNSGGLTLNIIVLSREDVANVVAAFDKQSGT